MMENVHYLQSFFSHDFSAVNFDAAHDDHNNSNFCTYCYFNCVLKKLNDVVCICLDVFLCSYRYTQRNVPKSSNPLRMKQMKHELHQTFKTNKNTAYERRYA